MLVKKMTDFEAMKGITMLLVVFAHVTIMFTPLGVIPLAYSLPLEIVTNFIYLFHMPAFIFVSGAIYYFVKRTLGKYSDSRIFFKNKFVRIIIPFLFFSIFIVLPVLMYLNLRTNPINFVAKEVILGMSGTHLWYSVTIFNIFVLFNFFENKIFNTRTSYLWIILFLLNIASYGVPNVFQIAKTLRYLIYFYGGYAFQKNRNTVLRSINLKLFSSIAVLIVTYLLIYHSPIKNIKVIEKVLLLIGGFSGTSMLYILSLKISHSKIMGLKLFQIVINSSYGIFLFHPMINYLLTDLSLNTTLNPYITVLINFMVTMFVSIICVYIFKQLRLNVFLGEKKPK